MWIGAISLATGYEVMKDAEGFRKYVVNYGGQIPANILDVTRNDAIVANQLGYTADITVEINVGAYNGEGYFRNEATGTEYTVKRTFRPNKKNTIQITGEVREHGKL